MTGFIVGAGLAGLATLIAALRHRFVVVRVEGLSMLPTLRPGERVLVRRGGLARVRPHSVVVLAPPRGIPAVEQGSTRWLIKRAVALPGETAPPGSLPAPCLAIDSVVPPGRLVVLGDNAARSLDSRTAGYFDADGLLGVVVRSMRG